MVRTLPYLSTVAVAILYISCIGNKAETDDTQHLITAAEKSKSLHHYEQRMQFRSQRAKELCKAGIKLHEKGDNAAAKKLLLKSLDLEPENAVVLTSLGHVSYAARDYDEALEYYNRSHIMYDPKDLNAGVHLGRSYYLNGEYEKCIIISKYTLSQTQDEKSYYMSYYNLTKALIKKGDCEEAERSFKKTEPAIYSFKDLRSRIHVLEHEVRNCASK